MRIPICKGERAASMHCVKVRGARDSPNGRTLYCYATPSNANLKNRLQMRATCERMRLSDSATCNQNTLSSAPSAKRGSKRQNRECLQGGPAVARFRPLLILPGCSGSFLRRRIQGDQEVGALGWLALV